MFIKIAEQIECNGFLTDILTEILFWAKLSQTRKIIDISGQNYAKQKKVRFNEFVTFSDPCPALRC